MPRAGEAGVVTVAGLQPGAVRARGGNPGVRIMMQEAELVPLAVETVGDLDGEQCAALGRGAEAGAEVSQMRVGPFLPGNRGEARAQGPVAVLEQRAH